MSLERIDSPPTDLSAAQAKPWILVIDDDHGFRPALCEYLRRFHFQTSEAKSGIEGLVCAQAQKPDLIVLDLCLDGRGSNDTRSAELFLKALKSDRSLRPIPVVAISGMFHSDEASARFKSLGTDSFIYKGNIFEDGHFLRMIRGQTVLGQALAPAAPPADSHQESVEALGLPDAGFPLELTILVIDDEEDTANLLKQLLKEQRILWADTGAKGLSLAKSELPDLVILDLHMPNLDGKQVCERLRANDTSNLYLPVLMHTGDQRCQEEVVCLDIGADDYLVKAGSNARLLAKIRAMVRRRRFRTDSRGVQSIGGVRLDLKLHTISVKSSSRLASLTKAEAAIVLLLMSGEGALIDTRAIHKKICRAWPNSDSTAIKTHVSHIRHKLGEFARLIESVKGEDGYRFNVELAKTLL